MAIQPRISATPRRSAIPITQTPVSPLADALDVAARTMGQMVQSDRQATQQVDAVNHQLAVKRQQDEDNALLLQQAAKWAETEGRIAVRIDEARRQHGPGGAGHVKSVQDIIAEEQTAFDAGFGQNERVRQRYTDNVAQTAARYETRETMYAADQFDQTQGKNSEAYLKATGNSLQLDPSLEKMDEATKLWDNIVVGMAANDDRKKEIYQKGRASLFGDFLTGLINTGKYDDAEKLIQSGKLNGVIDDVKPFVRSIETERNAARIAVEQQQADMRTEAREAVKAVEEKVKLGINPSQAEIAQVRAAAISNGLPEADIIALDGMGIQIGLNRNYNETADPLGIKASAAATRLGAKVAAGTASEAEQVSYAHLKGIGDTRAKARGAQLKEQAQQGIGGQAAVLAELRDMPAEQRYLAAEEAKSGLGQLALLGPRSQQYALEGREVRAARKDDFGKADDVKAAFARRIGGVASSLGGEYDNIQNIAWDIYAGELNGRGASGWDDAQFDVAVKIALGATKRDNGQLQGGVGRVRGKQVILPDWKTPEEFDKTLSMLKFAGAIYDNKEPASKADILTNYRPEYYADDAAGQPLYRFIAPSGKPLRHKDGSIYNLVVQR